MFEQEPQKLHRSRIAALLFLFLTVLAVYTGVLYDTQITHGDEYLSQAVHTITRTETVPIWV